MSKLVKNGDLFNIIYIIYLNNKNIFSILLFYIDVVMAHITYNVPITLWCFVPFQFSLS